MCPLCHYKERHLLAIIRGNQYWDCARCRLVALDERAHLAAVAEKERYELHNNDPEDQQYRQFLRRLTDPLLPYLERGAVGLDYGCGPGPTLSLILEEEGFQMEIFDPYFAPDQSLLERTYDFITCSETVEHFCQPAVEFERFDQCLKVGGWLGIMTQMLTANIDFESWWYQRDPTHVVFYRPETMQWIAKQWGWSYIAPAANISLFRKGGEIGRG